jgi:hypothetical protein
VCSSDLPRRHARYRQRAYSRAAGDPRASYDGPAPNDPATPAGATQAAPASVPPLAAPAQVAKNKAPPVQTLE